MDEWNKTKTDILKNMVSDPGLVDSLLEQLSSYAGILESEGTGDYGLPLDTAAGRDLMRMVVLSWFAKLGQ